MSLYGERDGIWHIVQEREALSGAETGQPVELGGVEPKPLCWRCRVAENSVQLPG